MKKWAQSEDAWKNFNEKTTCQWLQEAIEKMQSPALPRAEKEEIQKTDADDDIVFLNASGPTESVETTSAEGLSTGGAQAKIAEPQVVFPLQAPWVDADLKVLDQWFERHRGDFESNLREAVLNMGHRYSPRGTRASWKMIGQGPI